MKNRGLGRGLSALLKEEVVPLSSNNSELIKIIDIALIEAGVYQPRKRFELDKIQELAASITSSGVLQPIIVTSDNNNASYKIVAGERRWRACKLAGINEIPAIIKNYSNQEILKNSLLENIQREELSAMEEAEGLNQLIKEFNYTQDQLSQMLGKSRSHIANLLRLNHLPASVKDKLNEGLISMGHARCLIGQESAEEIAEYIVKNDLNVRRTESIIKNWSKHKSTDIPHKNKKKSTTDSEDKHNEDLAILARSLSEKFGIRITIEELEEGGKVTLHYGTLEELDSILMRLN